MPLKNLQEVIRIKRSELIITAEDYGLTHEQTIKSSQELDKLINEYLAFTPMERFNV
ncbi:Spo0E family sporulation regulatory protein-aspartic acid phosphatase [Peribacillus sp. SCS-26]|uniref:Spo0E family sporulation regulatory protein-aspartic acid phosphatase n=1 Tax=Paraperibacillus marinus TaxID=3115295 RepID=UPI003905CCE8